MPHTTHTALYEAVRTGDVAAIDAYSAQDSVCTEVQETNTFIASHASSTAPSAVLSFPPSFPSIPWYRETPYYRQWPTAGFLFDIAIQRRRIAVMEWFFAPARVASMGATLAHLLQDIGICAMEARQLEVLELILSSSVFHELLSVESQQRLLNTLLCSVGRRRRTGARQLLLAHGAQIPYQNNSDDYNDSYRYTNEEDRALAVPVVLPMIPILVATSRVGCLVGDLLGIQTSMLTTELVHRLRQHRLQENDVKSSDLLWIAASMGNVPTVHKLLKRLFVDVDVCDGQGHTALISAAAACTPSAYTHKTALVTVELLLEYGADVTLRDDHGRTALHYAVTLEHTGMAKVLLQYGADPNAVDADGAVPLDGVRVQFIHEPKHAEMLALMLRYGADPTFYRTQRTAVPWACHQQERVPLSSPQTVQSCPAAHSLFRVPAVVPRRVRHPPAVHDRISLWHCNKIWPR